MSNLVERVAKAIDAAREAHKPWDSDEVIARAAIAVVLREMMKWGDSGTESEVIEFAREYSISLTNEEQT